MNKQLFKFIQTKDIKEFGKNDLVIDEKEEISMKDFIG